MIYIKLGMFTLIVTVALLTGCKSNQPANAQASGPNLSIDVSDK